MYIHKDKILDYFAACYEIAMQSQFRKMLCSQNVISFLSPVPVNVAVMTDDTQLCCICFLKGLNLMEYCIKC